MITKLIKLKMWLTSKYSFNILKVFNKLSQGCHRDWNDYLTICLELVNLKPWSPYVFMIIFESFTWWHELFKERQCDLHWWTKNRFWKWCIFYHLTIGWLKIMGNNNTYGWKHGKVYN
jgi:hypothetical protein